MASDDEDIPELVETTTPTAGAPTASAPARVPLTIITGFLGAGKSTLLQYILTERHGYRIAVIMNEFGDTADIEGRKIDVSDVSNNSEQLSEEFLEVANGCLCCSIKDSGAAAIEKLMQKRGRFDYILLETTGLADPGPIASIFWHNEDLSEDILLDGVVCVVDGVFGLQQIENDKATGEVKESLRQVGCADIIMLNKADIAKPEDISNLESTIRQLNPTVPIERTIKGNIDLAKILDLRAYSAQPNFFDTAFAGQSAHDSSEKHEHVHDGDCSHINDITSMLIPIPVLKENEAQRLDEWIRTVLWEGHLPGTPERTLEVLRCKGVWQVDDGRIFVLQGVKSLYETREEKRSNEDAEVAGKVVLIGRGLEKDVLNSLQKSLQMA
ncbi:hypothetical protein M407DRAFT_126582 [Tulasnella calospora MUT 4182]|uniref:CobW C-terminal domain-containing protein n=1 Tax=Tulasnella calospora MUT 4182 TaxID=1051891 RepID=A0A0C3LJ05_9AGAM|nr:hypothetical protein M407DRAFT_126582 [Tulasnella calospora MUT 4182]